MAISIFEEWCMLLVIQINLILCEQFGMVNGEIYHVPYRLYITKEILVIDEF